jgi:hypothetical protein
VGRDHRQDRPPSPWRHLATVARVQEPPSSTIETTARQPFGAGPGGDGSQGVVDQHVTQSEPPTAAATIAFDRRVAHIGRSRGAAPPADLIIATVLQRFRRRPATSTDAPRRATLRSWRGPRCRRP